MAGGVCVLALAAKVALGYARPAVTKGDFASVEMDEKPGTSF